MKAFFKAFLLCTTIFIVVYSASAQGDYNSSLMFQVGFNSANEAIAQDRGWHTEIDEDRGTLAGTNSPAFFIRGEFLRVISISVDLAYNQSIAIFEANPDAPYQNVKTTRYDGSCFTFGSRALWHLLENDLGRMINGDGEPTFDLYVGAGGYVGFWSYKQEKENMMNAGVGIVPYICVIVGAKYFFTDRLGASIEYSNNDYNRLGVGLSYRFTAGG